MVQAEPRPITCARPTFAPFDLARARGAAEMLRHLEDVGDAGGAERMPLGQQAARDVHGDAAAPLDLALVDHAARLAVGAQPEVLVVQQLGGGEAVVELDQVEVVRTDAGASRRPPWRRCA